MKEFKQSQTEIINRSQIHFAPYNPKKHSDEQVKSILKDLKKNGFYGGVVWNKTTGNLIDGHKRVMAHDLYHKYNGTPERDYQIKVEVAEFDEQTEKIRNIWHTKSQTPLDDDLMRQLVPDLENYQDAGLTEFDISMYSYNVDDYDMDLQGTEKWSKNTDENEELQAIDLLTKESEENKKIDRSVNFYEDTPENQIARHNEIKKVKDRIKNTNNQEKDGGMLSYVILKFDNPKNKESFCIRMGYNPHDKIIIGEEFSQNIERID
ncbi:hypothetical protein CAPN008_01280 [Capnocytophaga canis]|uniref:DNA methylase n=1 Tax=Capnocytophaga canis TaxID=1848903 RepID=UPI001AC9C54A|nr:DNA methylase [Capnocytophaga canis]GIM60078.1 hypothetical protein CAPN008_01280 [Capnocytophaga canis]